MTDRKAAVEMKTSETKTEILNLPFPHALHPKQIWDVPLGLAHSNSTHDI